MYVCFALLINILKFLYICGMEWLMRKRIPFHDELQELFKLEWFYKNLPPRYRPKRTLEDYASNVHLSARLVAELRDAFDDGEGEGERKKRKEEEKALRAKERARIRKQKRKLKKRMEKKNFKASSEDEIKLDEEEPDSPDEDEPTEEDLVKFGDDRIADDKDKFKRKNVALLRIPFDTKVDINVRTRFLYITIGAFVFLALFKFTTSTVYVVHENLTAYGTLSGQISLYSVGIIIFALFCDFKEMYFTYKNVIPARPEWVPYVTVDLTDDVKSLFIGSHQVLLSDITENEAFSKNWIISCAACYLAGCFPWCTFSLIIRDQYLNFGSMRIVTPTLASIFSIVRVSRVGQS
jgi:hypothetical protein